MCDNPITIMDVALARGANEDCLNGNEFERLGLPMLGGCEVCGACIAAYNACPSQSGYLRCLNGCIGDYGFPTERAFSAWEKYIEALEIAEIDACSREIEAYEAMTAD